MLKPKSPFRKTAPGKWREIGGKRIYMRSKWEWNYALYLQDLLESGAIESWEYEPKEFWFLKIKRGVRSYKPDFRIVNLEGDVRWREVKGYLDAKSRTKIKRFKKYYPDESLSVIDHSWFRHTEREHLSLYPLWEPIFSKKSKKKELKNAVNSNDQEPSPELPKKVRSPKRRDTPLEGQPGVKTTGG